MLSKPRPIAPVSAVLSQDSTADGYVFVPDTQQFLVNSRAKLSGTALPDVFVFIVEIVDKHKIAVRFVTVEPIRIIWTRSDVSVYTVAASSTITVIEQLVEVEPIKVTLDRQTNLFKVDATVDEPLATSYLPVRLTDGSAFYTASGGSGGGGLTDTELRASPVPVSLTGTTITGSVAVTGTFFQATQPVSIASVPLPTGAATEATLALIKAKTDNLDVALSTRAVTGLTDTQLRASVVPVSLTSTTITGSVAVTGPLTDAQLRATPVPVSGTVVPLSLEHGQFNQAIQPTPLLGRLMAVQ